MHAENWLGSYGTIDGLAHIFRRVSSRRTFLSPLVGAEKDLTSHYHSLGKAICIFYPQVMEFAEIFCS